MTWSREDAIFHCEYERSCYFKRDMAPVSKLFPFATVVVANNNNSNNSMPLNMRFHSSEWFSYAVSAPGSITLWHKVKLRDKYTCFH